MEKKIIFSTAVFIAGLCSIVYELLISTAATYFLGDGVKQFSIIIGVYLFSMGIGAYLSKFHKNRSLLYFVRIEFFLGLVGGISVPLIYYLFLKLGPGALQAACLGIVFVIGLLTGMEVPLLTFSHEEDVEDSLAEVLSLDYIGGLIATLIFPFILLPFVGLFYSSLIFGGVNILLGLYLTYKFFKARKGLWIMGGLMLLFLAGLGIKAGQLLKIWDQKIYKHPIIYNERSPFQKIVLTKTQDDVRLFLNRVIQFSSIDEHRYHESLVHTPLSFLPEASRVLVLGGGENLASRELLKHMNLSSIDVVDIDPTIFNLAKHNEHLLRINQGAALDPRVNLIPQDAFTFLHENENAYDLIIADLPDPVDQNIARLYSRQFFYLVKRNLASDGLFVTQAGEIYFANTVFSCIHNTVQDAFAHVRSFHTYVPSFGDWGFIMASDELSLNGPSSPLMPGLQYLTPEEQRASFILPADLSVIETKVNTMDSPVILEYYLDDWNKWKVDLTHNPSTAN